MNDIILCGQYKNYPLDSGLHLVDSGCQVLDSGSLPEDIGFLILMVRRIPDFLGCIWIPRPRISDSTSKNFSDSRIRISLHEANKEPKRSQNSVS